MGYDNQWLEKNCDCGAPDTQPTEQAGAFLVEVAIFLVLAVIGFGAWMVWGQ